MEKKSIYVAPETEVHEVILDGHIAVTASSSKTTDYQDGGVINWN